ncbi:MAG: DoxX family protein [Pseudonocardiales bacterium]|nr:DoxX family protein [Pseudonocardiales bacterium]PZS29245.1 MAG: DoxX family protein [Pseudonocardiales bacterium]
MVANQTLRAPAAVRERTTDIALRVVQVLLAAFFLLAAAGPKLVGQQYAVEMFTQIGAGQWLRYLVGGLELAGAIGLLIPRLAALAALGLAGVMIGAVISQVLVLGSVVMALTPAFLGIILGLIAWRRAYRSAS